MSATKTMSCVQCENCDYYNYSFKVLESFECPAPGCGGALALVLKRGIKLQTKEGAK